MDFGEESYPVCTEAFKLPEKEKLFWDLMFYVACDAIIIRVLSENAFN